MESHFTNYVWNEKENPNQQIFVLFCFSNELFISFVSERVEVDSSCVKLCFHTITGAFFKVKRFFSVANTVNKSLPIMVEL